MTRRCRSCSTAVVYDPMRMETVLRVTIPRIGKFERRQGLVVPRSRPALRGGRPVDGNRTVFRGSSKKNEKFRPRSDAGGVHECEGLREESDGKFDDDSRQNDVYL